VHLQHRHGAPAGGDWVLDVFEGANAPLVVAEVELESADQPLEVLVSPEAIALRPDSDGEAWVQGREFLGREWLYQVQLGELKLRLRLPLEAEYGRGQRCELSLRPGAKGILFPTREPLQVLEPGPT
jgi:iron(III) transport system ATP-binding protein